MLAQYKLNLGGELMRRLSLSVVAVSLLGWSPVLAEEVELPCVPGTGTPEEHVDAKQLTAQGFDPRLVCVAMAPVTSVDQLARDFTNVSAADVDQVKLILIARKRQALDKMKRARDELAAIKRDDPIWFEKTFGESGDAALAEMDQQVTRVQRELQQDEATTR